jgi:hypothetical protein
MRYATMSLFDMRVTPKLAKIADTTIVPSKTPNSTANIVRSRSPESIMRSF